MRTTKKDFERFKKAFNCWAGKFGLQGYKVVFKHKLLDSSFAYYECNHQGRIATVGFSTQYRDDEGFVTPEHHGKHEAIHLLISRLVWLGEKRYVRKNEIAEEEEAIVRILEKVL